MPKRLHQADGGHLPPSSGAAWSVGSGRLTPAGQSELLKQLGRQLQAGYQSVLKEPTPDRIKELVEKLETHYDQTDEDAMHNAPHPSAEH